MVESESSHTAAAALQALIGSRTTIHDFSSDPLPDGALQRSIAAGLSAPNHRMTEPWRFIRTGRATREQLGNVQARLKDKGRTPSDDALARAREKFLGSAELLVLCRVVHADPNVAREDYAAIACAVQNISLCLWAEGISSKWSTGGVTTDAETYRILGVDPAIAEVVGFLWLGYPKTDNQAKKPPRRLTVAQVLSELP